jgi:hypothetical protein
MPVIQKKLSDLPKSSVIPAATYRLRVNKCDLFTAEDARAKKADTKITEDNLNMDFVVIDEGERFGRHIFDNLPLGGEFAWRTRQFLDAMEYPSDEDLDTDKLIDGEVIAVVTVQKESIGKDGNTYPERNRIQKFMKVQ